MASKPNGKKCYINRINALLQHSSEDTVKEVYAAVAQIVDDQKSERRKHQK